MLGLEIGCTPGVAVTPGRSKSNEGASPDVRVKVCPPNPNPRPDPLVGPVTGTGTRARERSNSIGTVGGQGLGLGLTSREESPRSGSRTRASWPKRTSSERSR